MVLPSRSDGLGPQPPKQVFAPRIAVAPRLP